MPSKRHTASLAAAASRDVVDALAAIAGEGEPQHPSDAQVHRLLLSAAGFLPEPRATPSAPGDRARWALALLEDPATCRAVGALERVSKGTYSTTVVLALASLVPTLRQIGRVIRDGVGKDATPDVDEAAATAARALDVVFSGGGDLPGVWRVAAISLQRLAESPSRREATTALAAVLSALAFVQHAMLRMAKGSVDA